MEACFADLTGHIHAVETGLSSDPPMNWRVSALDGLTLVSHSDAHSPLQAGPGGRRPGHRPELPGAGGGHPHRSGVFRHHRVLPGGGEVPPGRPPELRGVPDPGRDGGPWRRLSRVREKADHRRGAPGGGAGGPARRLSSKGGRSPSSAWLPCRRSSPPPPAPPPPARRPWPCMNSCSGSWGRSSPFCGRCPSRTSPVPPAPARQRASAVCGRDRWSAGRASTGSTASSPC